MTTQLHESEVEEAALSWFDEFGYDVLHGPGVAPGEPGAEREGFDEVVLAKRLHNAIGNLNPDIPHEARDEAFRKVLRPDSPSLVGNNRAFHAMLRDGVEAQLNLPNGKYEIPIVIQDRTFNDDGTLWYLPWWEEEYFANTIVVNGKVMPFMEVEPRRYRFRFLNGSNGRAYWMYLRDEASGIVDPDTTDLVLPGNLDFIQRFKAEYLE